MKAIEQSERIVRNETQSRRVEKERREMRIREIKREKKEGQEEKGGQRDQRENAGELRFLCLEEAGIDLSLDLQRRECTFDQPVVIPYLDIHSTSASIFILLYDRLGQFSSLVKKARINF